MLRYMPYQKIPNPGNAESTRNFHFTALQQELCWINVCIFWRALPLNFGGVLPNYLSAEMRCTNQNEYGAFQVVCSVSRVQGSEPSVSPPSSTPPNICILTWHQKVKESELSPSAKPPSTRISHKLLITTRGEFNSL